MYLASARREQLTCPATFTGRDCANLISYAEHTCRGVWVIMVHRVCFGDQLIHELNCFAWDDHFVLKICVTMITFLNWVFFMTFFLICAFVFCF